MAEVGVAESHHLHQFPVPCQHAVRRQQQEGFAEGLGDEQAIEGIVMVVRQLRHAGGMSCADGQFNEAAVLDGQGKLLGNGSFDFLPNLAILEISDKTPGVNPPDPPQLTERS